jgi:hypothetical protein
VTVTYEPPLSRSSAQVGESLGREVIESGPAYVRGPRSTRWHRVRAGQRQLRQNYRTGEVTVAESFTSWCGQSLFERAAGRQAGTLLFADAPATDEPACGTCEGRYIGADNTRPEWLFSPTRLLTPKQCPGSHTMLVREDQGRWNRATCLVCGDVVKMGAHGGPYASRFDARVHTPGQGLIAGCPWHAWRELTTALDNDGNTVAACRCMTIARAS